MTNEFSNKKTKGEMHFYRLRKEEGIGKRGELENMAVIVVLWEFEWETNRTKREEGIEKRGELENGLRDEDEMKLLSFLGWDWVIEPNIHMIEQIVKDTFDKVVSRNLFTENFKG